MVALYIGERQVGTVAVSIDELAQLKKGGLCARDEDGNTVTLSIVEPICPWNPELTREEIDRRVAEGGTSLADFWKKMGRS